MIRPELKARIEAALLLDEKRTQGEWRSYNIFGPNHGQVFGILPQGKALDLPSAPDAAFIASAPAMAAIIRELLAEVERVSGAANTALHAVDELRAMNSAYDRRDKQARFSKQWRDQESMALEHADIAEKLEMAARSALASTNPKQDGGVK